MLPKGRAAAALSRLLEDALEHVDLTVSQYRLLEFLSHGSRAATVLADYLTVSRPSITSLADGLAGRGYLTREPDPRDRRRVLHVITDEGRQAVRAADTAFEETMRELLRHIDEDDAATLDAGLSALAIAVTNLREQTLASPDRPAEARTS